MNFEGVSMKDLYGRKIDYMRISLTDQCPFACYYCKTEEVKPNLNKNLLSYEELYRIVEVAVSLDIVKFKITGGEPTLRKGYIDFIEKIKQIPKLEQVTLTTNGACFTHQDLIRLKQIGIDGINFSIDSLDPVEFFGITKQNCLKTVLKNLEDAYQLGIKVKINSVVDETFTYKRGNQLIHYALDHSIPLRFIEYMPLNQKQNNPMFHLFQSELKKHYQIHSTSKTYGNGPARYFFFDDFLTPIGFIEALSHQFCDSCNRLRLSCEGKIQMCLFYPDQIDLKSVLNDPEKIQLKMKEAIHLKPKQHHFNEEISKTKMNQIGG